MRGQFLFSAWFMKFSWASLRCLLGAILLTVGVKNTVQAENVEGPNETKSVALEGITVTANKIEEDIHRVPQSITVIDEYALEEKGIRNVADVIDQIPNMSIITSMGSLVNFRGLNISTFTHNNPVVIYIDGVPYSDKFGFDASMANVARIEVLRGPQGTLYGKDAIGAVINVVTKQPQDFWEGKVGVEYGSYNTIQGLFNTGGPLVKGLLYGGINGQVHRSDGWIRNTHSGMDKNANAERDHRLSGYLLYRPNGKFDARLTISNDYTKKNWVDGYGLPGGTDISAFNRRDAKYVDFDVPTVEKTQSNAQSLHAAYDFGGVTLTSTTTHRKLDLEGDYDVDYGNNPLFAGLKMFNPTEIDTWTQELRLSSSNSGGIRWIVGGYFDLEARDQVALGMQFPEFDPATFDFLGNFEVNAQSKTDSNTRAVFGQAMVPLGDRFEITLGGRYQRIEKEIDLNTYYLPVGSSGAPMFALKSKKTWDVFLPKAALSFRISDAWTTYVSYSQGYMPGGFNYYAMAGTAEDNTFEPQKATNYEWGIKGDYRLFRVAASVFRMNIEDIHVYRTIGTMLVTDNAKKAHSQGAELELMYLPVHGVELSAGIGIIDAEYDDYDAGTVRFDGRKVELTPSHTARIGVAYYHPRGLYTRLEAKNQGAMYFFDDFKNDFVKQGSTTLADVRIGYKFSNWDIFGYVKNLTDEAYITRFMSSSIMTLATFGQPRTFGVGARYQF